MLTKTEQTRLAELSAKKQKSKLDDQEFAEFKDLLKKKSRGGKEKKDSKADAQFKPGNDFSWWNKIPELIENSANFKSNYIAGDPVSSNISYTVPGVLEVGMRTCYYPSVTPTDPVNVWARDLYLRMFQKYRPASGYGASDLGISLFAGLEAVKLIAAYERVYGTINRYSVLNLNMPYIELEAMGISAAQATYLQSHLSDFRYDLNYLIRKAQRLCLPKDISFIADAISLFGYEYCDHNTPRGQIIIFNLENVGLYSDTTLTTGGSIQFNSLGAGKDVEWFDFTADNMCVALETVLNALLGSDSVQRIYADLNVWFGEGAMLQFLPIPEEYVVAPIFSESILHKLHNSANGPVTSNTVGSALPANMASWAHNGLSTTDEDLVLNGQYWVYQYNDKIITVARMINSGAASTVSAAFHGVSGKTLNGSASIYTIPPNQQILDGYKEVPDHEFVVEGSLWKFIPSHYQTSGLFINSCVNWLITKYVLHTNNVAPDTLYNNAVGTTATFAGKFALIDWAPICYTSSSGMVNGLFGDLDVIIPLSENDLNRIHRACFLSGIHTDVKVINK